MLKSMTAFGRASIAIPIGRFTVEIQSVNRKFLDISVTLPKELSRFEIELKKWVSAEVERGQVTTKVLAQFDTIAPVSITPNMPLVKQLIDAWNQIADELGAEKRGQINLALLAQEEGIFSYSENLQDDKLYREALQLVVNMALKEFIQMRRAEGAALAKDITQRIDILRTVIKSIEAKAPDTVKKTQQKLKERMEELLPGRVENEERILREIALYAEKADIAEEITRFHSHLDQFLTFLNKKEGSVGKTLEFLVQELGREINTIGSKSMDAALAHHVVDVKSELDRIREQIQNIE